MYLTFLKRNNPIVYTKRDYTIDDIFNGVEFNEDAHIQSFNIQHNNFITKTVITDKNPSSYKKERIEEILTNLSALGTAHSKMEINSEYDTFYIPKKKGGLREINAPKEQLMRDLRQMKDIFEHNLNVLTHNAAYAYTKNKNTTEALRLHQKNNSRWFLKLDIKKFFNNCTEELVINKLKEIYPFHECTEEQLKEILWICFRNGELPQGTPMSPLLTNLIMIPFDYHFQKYCWKHRLVYTRYADDILISAQNSWDYKQTVIDLEDLFKELDYPFILNAEKTRYGSSAGRNWNLGLMLNKDNNITVGYKNKKRYKAMIFDLMQNKYNWTKDQLYHFQGITSYYLSIEPEYFSKVIKQYEQQFHTELKSIYKELL